MDKRKNKNINANGEGRRARRIMRRIVKINQVRGNEDELRVRRCNL